MRSSDQRLPFRVGTWNRGNGTPEDARELITKCDWLGAQEMSDGQAVAAAIQRAGWHEFAGRGGAGEAATPVFWNPAALRKVQLHSFPMLVTDEDRAWGPGAGPEVAKPKHAIGGTWVHKATGQTVSLLNTHLPSSQYRKGRRRAATLHAERLVQAAQSLPGTVFLTGDFNARPDASTLAALRRAGFRCDQVAGMTLPTHDVRPIDQVWWK